MAPSTRPLKPRYLPGLVQLDICDLVTKTGKSSRLAWGNLLACEANAFRVIRVILTLNVVAR